MMNQLSDHLRQVPMNKLAITDCLMKYDPDDPNMESLDKHGVTSLEVNNVVMMLHWHCTPGIDGLATYGRGGLTRNDHDMAGLILTHTYGPRNGQESRLKKILAAVVRVRLRNYGRLVSELDTSCHETPIVESRQDATKAAPSDDMARVLERFRTDFGSFTKGMDERVARVEGNIADLRRDFGETP